MNCQFNLFRNYSDKSFLEAFIQKRVKNKNHPPALFSEKV